MLIGSDRIVIARLTTPPITNRMAAKSTKPCFKGEAPFIFPLNLRPKNGLVTG